MNSAVLDDHVNLSVHADPEASGAAAASLGASLIRAAIDQRGEARLIFAAAPSQEWMLSRLRVEPGIDWNRVRAFHMDEYVGLPDGAPQAFARWLTERLPPLRFEPMAPHADPAAEMRRYAALLAAGPIDVTFLGIGVNGHIAFNEPRQCSFTDPEPIRLVALDPVSRKQQVDDLCFSSLDEVPHQALTLTVPALLRASAVVGVVPGRHKAEAVARMVTGRVGPHCPASALRTHPDHTVFLDSDAASLLGDAISRNGPAA